MMMIESLSLELALGLVAGLVLVGFIWAPKTWIPGELVSAASMNGLRDHLNEALRTQTTTATGDQDDLAIDGPFAYVRCNNASALSITGLLIDSGNVSGARLILEALDASVTIRHQDTGSATANRIICDSGADFVLSGLERALLMYDSSSSRWRAGKIGTGAIVQSIGAVNFFPDPFFRIWPAGDNAAPAGSTFSGDGASQPVRNTTIPYNGEMCLELELANDATISSKITYPLFAALPTFLRGKYVGVGAQVRTDIASMAKLEVDDGGTGSPASSPYHSGGDTFEWIAFTHQIAADASKLDLAFVADIAAQTGGVESALFDAVTITFGPLAPADFQPPRQAEGSLYFPIISAIQAEADKFRFSSKRPFIVELVTIRAKTEPTGQDAIFDVNHWNGSSFVSMFSTRPQIDDGDPSGEAAPDGTYRYRCFEGLVALDETDALLSVDVDQAGSTEPGQDAEIYIRILQAQDPWAALKL